MVRQGKQKHRFGSLPTKAKFLIFIALASKTRCGSAPRSATINDLTCPDKRNGKCGSSSKQAKSMIALALASTITNSVAYQCEPKYDFACPGKKEHIDVEACQGKQNQ